MRRLINVSDKSFTIFNQENICTSQNVIDHTYRNLELWLTLWFLKSQGNVKTSMFITKTPPKIHTLSCLYNCYLDVCLKVISLDGAENLPKSSRFYNEMHKLYTQPFTQIHHLHWGSRKINIKNSQIHLIRCMLMFSKIGTKKQWLRFTTVFKNHGHRASPDSYCSHCHIIFTVIL